MLPQNIFVTVNQIIFYCEPVLKRAALQLHSVATSKKYHQPRSNKGRMLCFHKLHLATFPTGDVVNIFASVKIWPWPQLRPWCLWCNARTRAIGRKVRFHHTLPFMMKQRSQFGCGYLETAQEVMESLILNSNYTRTVFAASARK